MAATHHPLGFAQHLKSFDLSNDYSGLVTIAYTDPNGDNFQIEGQVTEFYEDLAEVVVQGVYAAYGENGQPALRNFEVTYDPNEGDFLVLSTSGVFSAHQESDPIPHVTIESR
mgnify:CR=1 FL=1